MLTTTQIMRQMPPCAQQPGLTCMGEKIKAAAIELATLHGEVTTAMLADRLDISIEHAGKHMRKLEQMGMFTSVKSTVVHRWKTGRVTQSTMNRYKLVEFTEVK